MAFPKLKQKRGASAAPVTGDRLEDLHAAIVHDDDGLMLRLLTADASLAAHSFGRFPLLSLCYMYRSRKIVRKFAPRLRAHGDNYSVSPEYPEDYRKFRGLAGRSLRLFREGFVSYADMLAVIGDAPALRAELGASPSKEQSERIAKIYELTSKRKVRVKENGVSIPRSKKMNAVQITAVVLIAFFGLCAAGGALGAYYAVPAAFGGDGSSDAPILVGNAEQFLFAAGDTQKRYFKLTADVVIDASAYDELNVVSDIDCDGHTIRVISDGSPLFGDISGKLRNGIFDFGEVDITYSTDSALLTRTVTGAAESITLKASGSIKDTSGNETVYFGCLAVENSGSVNYVTAELDIEVAGASAGGESAGDSFFAGIVAVNSGSVAYCSVTENSVVRLDTADGAGIVAENKANGRVLDSTNAASISQTSSYAMWSPNSAGVVLNNYGTVNNCINSGDVTVASEATKEAVEEEMDKHRRLRRRRGMHQLRHRTPLEKYRRRIRLLPLFLYLRGRRCRREYRSFGRLRRDRQLRFARSTLDVLRRSGQRRRRRYSYRIPFRRRDSGLFRYLRVILRYRYQFVFRDELYSFRLCRLLRGRDSGRSALPLFSRASLRAYRKLLSYGKPERLQRRSRRAYFRMG